MMDFLHLAGTASTSKSVAELHTDNVYSDVSSAVLDFKFKQPSSYTTDLAILASFAGGVTECP